MTTGRAVAVATSVRLLERVGRAIVRCAPAGYRDAWGAETVATLRAMCLSAASRDGLRGLARTAALETISLAWMVVSLQLSFNIAPISPQTPRRRGRRSPVDGLRRFGHDLRWAWRSLAANRLNTAIAFVTLACGIGVNTSIFTIIDSVLWRPVPFRDADRLTTLANRNPQGITYQGMTRSLALAWRQQADLFDRVEVYERGSFVYASPDGASMVQGAIVSPGLLPMLGMPIAQGRLFTDADGRGGTDERAVVSDGFWRSELHGRRDAIGSMITLDGLSYEVVGIMPSAFRFPDERTEVWLPYNLDAPPPEGSGPSRRSIRPAFEPIVRVRRDVSMDQASGQVASRGGSLNASAGGDASITTVFVSMQLGLDERTERSLVVLAAAVVFLLLIVCANLASLALSRSLSRARDLAVRAALGASRADLVRQSAIESLVIGAGGAMGGAAMAAVLLALARTVMPDAVSMRSLNPIGFDERTVAFAAGLGILTALFFGLPPAYFASRTRIVDALRRGGRSIAGAGSSERLRSAFVVAEVALSMVLLVGAALMAHSLIKLTRVDRGLDATGVVALRLGLPAAGYTDVAARDIFATTIAERLRHVPGVEAVSLGGVPPETSRVSFGKVRVEGAAEEAGDPLIVATYEVTPEFFSTLRIPFKQGHTFAGGDPEGSVIISEAFARAHWPEGRALGSRFEIGSSGIHTVVGIVTDVNRPDTVKSSRSQIYYQVGRATNLGMPVGALSIIADYRTLVIRADDAARVVPALRAAVHDVDPKVVIWKIDLVEHLFADAIARPRVVFVLMTTFATFGLLLAAAGIYGVLTYLVLTRQQEIGIRLALGARPAAVARLIVRSGLGLTGVGLVLGLVAALGLVRVMRTLLYDVDPSDPLAIGGVVAVLLGTALLACWRPMRQAMRVDPLALLREG